MKILVNVYVPAISRSFDVLIPDFLKIKTITSMIAHTVEDLSDNLYVSSGEEHLFLREKEILFRGNTVLSKYGVQNGDHLVLM